MGTPDFSVPILRALMESEYRVIGVVTQPDRPVGRKKIVTASPVKQEALRHHLPIYQPEKLSGSPELVELLTLNIDLIVTAAYGQFLPEALLHYPTYRAINVHASLLPKYRGGAPIQYALMNEDEQTGVSIMYMEKKMDAGAILSQCAIPILDEDNVSTLFDKLSLLGRDLLLHTLPLLFDGNLTAIEQDEAQVTFSPAISRGEEQINWEKPAHVIRAKIRAMNSWPGAYTYLKNARFKIWQAVLTNETTTKPVGTIISTDQRFLVSCGQNSVLALEVVQPSGKSKMSIQEYLRGAGSQLEGERFGNEETSK